MGEIQGALEEVISGTPSTAYQPVLKLSNKRQVENSDMRIEYKNGAGREPSSKAPLTEAVKVPTLVNNVVNSTKPMPTPLPPKEIERPMKDWGEKEMPMKVWGEELFCVTFGEGPIGLHMVEDKHDEYGRYIIVKSFAKKSDGKMSPAEQCGKINIGDILVRVNNVSVLGYSFDNLVKLLGSSGTFLLFMCPIDVKAIFYLFSSFALFN